VRALFVTADGALRAPWRVALFFGATFVAGALVSSVGYGLLSLTPLVGLARTYRVPLDQIGALISLAIGTWVALRVDGRGVADWSRVGLSRAAWGARPAILGLAVGTLAILVPCALLLAAHRFAFESQPHAQGWFATAGAALVLLAPAAAVEELAMRGYLLHTLRDAWGARTAVVVTSVCFALLHLFNPDPTLLSTTTVALAGVLLAVVRLSTGSLVAAWTAHFAWNFAQAAVLHAPVSGLPLGSSDYRLADLGPRWLTGGTWGPEGGVAAAAGMLVATFLLVQRSRASAPGGLAPSVPNVENGT
jgi:hypothetical protein